MITISILPALFLLSVLKNEHIDSDMHIRVTPNNSLLGSDAEEGMKVNRQEEDYQLPHISTIYEQSIV